MEAQLRANKLRSTFQSIITKEIQSTFVGRSDLLCARLYVNGIIENADLQPGDYKMDYEHQYHKYTSYWFDVLNAL